MVPNVEGLTEFVLQHCGAPYSYAFSGEPAGSAGARMALDVDLMQLVDVWPEGGPLLSSHPLDEVLAMICPAIAAVLGITGQLSLRPTHLPPTLHAPLGQCAMSKRKDAVVLSGTIVRIFSKRVVPLVSALYCAMCRKEYEIRSDPFDRGAATRHVCDGGPRGAAKCKGTELSLVSQQWMDYTECRLQPRTVGAEGRLPRSVTVTLDDELATKCSAGQMVEVIGIVKTRWRQVQPRATPQIEVVIWAQNILPKEDGVVPLCRMGPSGGGADGGRAMDAWSTPYEFAKQYEGQPNRLRTLLVSSTCPQLSGLAGPRFGILLSAVGGAEVKDEKSGHRVRGSVHCLLVGDPSTGKSQLLRFAAQLAPRSVVTTGFTSSTAGLTAAATKEFGEWALEPGALVLSDGGTCVIDELRTVSASDRTALHEAMEQQTISVAKAGLVTRLRTECTVVAACNPPMKRGALATKGLSSDLGIGGPLLSRFDFIFLLWDACSDRLDEAVASHIVQMTSTESVAPLSADQLCKYLGYVRRRYAHSGGPLLDARAADLISRYYHHKRNRSAGHTMCDDVPITIRFLESIVRVTQSHAKLLLKQQCDVMDVALAIFVMERSAHTTQTSLFSDAGGVIRTGSTELDACFLASDDASLSTQTRILERIVEVFSAVELDASIASVVSQHLASGVEALLPSGAPSPKRPRGEGGGASIFADASNPLNAMLVEDPSAARDGWSPSVYPHSTMGVSQRSLTAHRGSATPFDGAEDC